jgi:DNA-binding XRE family transcriptional regulator
MTHPAPEQIREARQGFGLTQTAAAELIYLKLRAWQQYEKGDRHMHRALWEYWLLRAMLIPRD